MAQSKMTPIGGSGDDGARKIVKRTDDLVRFTVDRWPEFEDAVKRGDAYVMDHTGRVVNAVRVTQNGLYMVDVGAIAITVSSVYLLSLRWIFPPETVKPTAVDFVQAVLNAAIAWRHMDDDAGMDEAIIICNQLIKAVDNYERSREQK